MDTFIKRDLVRENVQILDGDLLEVPSGIGRYIVQQCCCICTKTAGLSASIAAKWSALNPYKGRKPIGRTHTATTDTRDEPGTALLLSSDGVNLISLFAQYSPGKPKNYTDGDVVVNDTAIARRNYFQRSLLAMKEIINSCGGGDCGGGCGGGCDGNRITLYFPYGIGCGLAGGKWELYEKMIRDFGRENPEYNIVIVKK